MIFISITAFCIAGIILLECLFRNSDFFSPLRLYFFFHSVALGVAFLALDRNMTPFYPLTSLVYFGSAACFLSGVLVLNLLVDVKVADLGSRVDFKYYNWKLHFCFATALLLFFVWGMYAAHHGTGQYPLLAKDKVKAITAFFAVKWSASVALCYGGVTLSLFFITLFRPKRFRKIFDPVVWVMIGTALFYSLALSRSGLVFFAVFAIVFYNHAIRRLSIPKLFLLFVFCASFIIVTGYLKVNGVQEKYKVKVKTSKVIQLAMKVPYMYLANNFWNLDYALNPENFQERHPTTYGFTALSGVLDMMALPGGNVGLAIHEANNFDDQFHKRSIKIHGWNTIGYQWDLYKDFGIAGVFLGPFFIGMSLGFLYFRIRTRPTIMNAAVYAFLSFFILGSFGGLFLENGSYIYAFFYLCLCCYLSECISSKPRTPDFTSSSLRTPLKS